MGIRVQIRLVLQPDVQPHFAILTDYDLGI